MRLNPFGRVPGVRGRDRYAQRARHSVSPGLERGESVGRRVRALDTVHRTASLPTSPARAVAVVLKLNAWACDEVGAPATENGPHAAPNVVVPRSYGDEQYAPVEDTTHARSTIAKRRRRGLSLCAACCRERPRSSLDGLAVRSSTPRRR